MSGQPYAKKPGGRMSGQPYAKKPGGRMLCAGKAHRLAAESTMATNSDHRCVATGRAAGFLDRQYQ